MSIYKIDIIITAHQMLSYIINFVQTVYVPFFETNIKNETVHLIDKCNTFYNHRYNKNTNTIDKQILCNCMLV